MAPTSVSISGSCIGTNNVNTCDNSTTTQDYRCSTNYNIQQSSTVPSKYVLVSQSTSFTSKFFTRRRLPRIKLLLDEVLEELQFLAQTGRDKEQCQLFHTLHKELSDMFYDLEDNTVDLLDSVKNSSESKGLKLAVKRLHSDIKRVSEATKRDIAMEAPIGSNHIAQTFPTPQRPSDPQQLQPQPQHLVVEHRVHLYHHYE
ncbi:hypothetical protein AB1N83_013133 [Pleurotus pulmonarius]